MERVISLVSNRIRNMIPSATSVLISKVAELRGQGVDLVGFNVGEPDFDTPAHIVEAAKKAMDAGYTKYTAVSGILELRKAICEKLKNENGVVYKPEEIVVSTGAKQAVNNAMQVICNPGDEVLLPTPCWVSYIEIIKLADAVPVLVPTYEKDGFQLDVQAVRNALTPKTKAIMLTTPNNPTGAVYSRKVLEELAQVVLENNLYVISDEIYENLIYGGSEHVCFSSISPEVFKRTALINGFSKSYAMTGWRIGYSATPLELAKGIGSLQGHTTSNANTISQYAALAALTGPQDCIPFMRKHYSERRDYLLKKLNSMPGIKCADAQGAFYLMPNVSSYYGKSHEGKLIKDSNDFCEFLLEKAHVCAVPGAAFEAPENIRISYSTSIESIIEGMVRMEKVISLLE